MEISEVYKELASHMIKGVMFHDQLSNYFDFLYLRGYTKCQEYHYFKETIAYRKLCKYYLNHHNMLIEEMPIEDPKLIPTNWYRYNRMEVDNSTKKTAIRNGLQHWKEWEESTKQFYISKYLDLVQSGYIADALVLSEMIEDVDCELKYADSEIIKNKSIDYDLPTIMQEQECINKRYEEKIEHLKIEL